MQCFAKAGRAVVAFLIAASGSLPALAQEGDRAIGEQIATRDCAGCHGLGSAKGVTVEGALVPSFSEIANRPHQTRERVQALLALPHRPMESPALGDRELRQLAEYIISLRN